VEKDHYSDFCFCPLDILLVTTFSVKMSLHMLYAKLVSRKKRKAHEGDLKICCSINYTYKESWTCFTLALVIDITSLFI